MISLDPPQWAAECQLSNVTLTLDSIRSTVNGCVSAITGATNWQGDLALGSQVALPALIWILFVMVYMTRRNRTQ